MILIEFTFTTPPMYICVCAAVTDRQIRAKVAEGADSLDDLRIDLGVAMNCGSCSAAAENVICETRAKLLHLDPYEMHCEAHHPRRSPANDSPMHHAHGAERPKRVWSILEVA